MATQTSRDAYLYNFSREACAENARLATHNYLGALDDVGPLGVREEAARYGVDDAIRRNSKHLRWDQALRDNLKRRHAVTYSRNKVWRTQYRPFVKQHCYVEYVLANRKYQLDKIFPASDTKNVAICLPGIGSTKPFSALVVDAMPDLHFVAFGQCFPRYRFERVSGAAASALFGEPELERRDNIPDKAVQRFRDHYNDGGITGDVIFDYVYGVLHAPAYRQRFANDLAKELPRVPLAPDFHSFARAGRELAALHLAYESCAEYPLELSFTGSGEPTANHFQLGRRAMRFADSERSELVVNEFIRLHGIPASAHRYEVNGRTPLGWFMDRYRITNDAKSGIVNDPNHWFADPRDLVTAICRLVHVSVETVRIVESLPNPLPSDPEPA